MSAKTLSRWFLIFTLLLVGTLIWCVISTSPASAQCDTPKSSCISCHGQGNHVTSIGDWNSVHVNQDMCINCHGGNGSTMDKDLAHESIVVQPLSDIYTNCHSCHPTDYTVRAAQFAATLNVTLGSCATPTSIAINNNSGGPPPGSIVMPSESSSITTQQQPFILTIGWLAILAFFLLGLGWLEHHRVER
jgi:hypothetical protein